MTDSLLVAEMNSRQSFANGHHSNLELAPTFGESQRLLREPSNLPCPVLPAVCQGEHFQEDGHTKVWAAKL